MKRVARGGLVALIALPAVLAGCGPAKPVINSVKPDRGLIGTAFRVTGENFEKTRRKSTLTVGGKKAEIVSWGENSVTAAVPISLTAGKYPVVVTTEGGPSNKGAYTVYATFTGSTPLPAMLQFLKNRKIDTEGMKFDVVATSKDSNWKIDNAVAPDGTTYYFLFRKTSDGWTIKDFDRKLTEERLRFLKAPGDLEAP